MKLYQILLITLLILCDNNIYSQNEIFDSSNFEFQTLFTSKDNSKVSCYRIPAIITTNNGVLIAAIDERVESCDDLKSNNDINIVIRRSEDNGITWKEIERIVDYPFCQSASDPSFIVDKITGEIFLFFNFMNLKTEKDIYYLKYISSTDNGKTWSSPKDISTQIIKPENKKDFQFITSGNGIQVSSGKLLHTLVNLNKGLYIFGSDDHGKNWYVIDNPINPADESKIVELDNGNWMVNSRVNKLGKRYIHISNDEGKTWKSNIDSTLIDPGCNASLINYKFGENNILLFSNAKSKDERNNMSISISYDEGKTWTLEKLIYSGSSAYSSMTILENGNVGLFFEKDDYTENVFVKLDINSILNFKKCEIVK
ncbi:MAG: exo-alpha-sialidase [Ignavibacteriae bacterium]|nr:exo-alpha-sialidase [Ignavibacteriota bacterium]